MHAENPVSKGLIEVGGNTPSSIGAGEIAADKARKMAVLLFK